MGRKEINRKTIWFILAVTLLISNLQGNLAYGQYEVEGETPTVTAGETNTSLKVSFRDFFYAYDENAYEVQLRQKSPQGDWTTRCHVITTGSRGGGNFSDLPLIGSFFLPGSRAGVGIVNVIFTGLEPATTYEARYRDTNLSDCGQDPPDPEPWTEVAEGTTRLEPPARVEFADPHLAWAVRSALGLDTAGGHIELLKIPQAELAGLRELIYSRDIFDLLFSSSNNIAELTGLEHATQLTKLILGHHDIADISPLAHLTALTELNLEGNQIRDISSLAHLTQLTGLGLAGNQIRDLTPLAQLKHLSRLFLGGNQIQDLTPLAQLTQLDWLFLEGNQIASLSGLERLALTKLSIKENKIRDISSLSQWTQWGQLSELELSGNQIEDIAPLAQLAQSSVTKLDLSENRISDVTPIPQLVDQSLITELDLSKNQISHIAPLAQLAQSSVTKLDLMENQISDVTPLAQLAHSSVTELDLSFNQILDVSPLASLVQLNLLFLFGNPISDRSPLLALLDARPGMIIDISIITLTASTSHPLTGARLNGSILTLQLSGGEFEYRIEDISENLTLSGIGGVTFNSSEVRKVSDSEVTVVLTFDSSVRIDTDTQLVITVGPGAIERYHLGHPLTAEILVFADGPEVPVLTKVSGDGQEGSAGVSLTDPFVVQVTDQHGWKLPGTDVIFTVTVGGGTLSAATVTTDANGRAECTLTLGSDPGLNIVAVTVVGGEPISFTAVGQVIPHGLEKISGDEQEGSAGTALPDPFVVEALDQNGSPLAGVVVTFTVTGGGGTLSAETTTTNDFGRVESILTLGPDPGVNIVTVTVASGQPVTFIAVGKAATPDFNGDGVVDFDDFFLFADAFGTSDPRFDLDDSGTVDFGDFFLFADNFGQPARSKLVAMAQEMIGLPTDPQLKQNAPNPFNNETVISWFLQKPGFTRLEVFALNGQRVAVLLQGHQHPGHYSVYWNGHDQEGRLLASGVYLYRLATAENVLTRKLILLH